MCGSEGVNLRQPEHSRDKVLTVARPMTLKLYTLKLDWRNNSEGLSEVHRLLKIGK